MNTLKTGEGYIVPRFVTVTADDLRLDETSRYLQDLITKVSVKYVSVRKYKNSRFKGKKWNAMQNLRFVAFIRKLHSIV